MSNNNTENEYIKKFHERRAQQQAFLEDKSNAQKFFDEKLKRAKDLTDSIFMITSGAFERTDDNPDWAHEILVELFTIFQIDHKNFSMLDFLEDLKTIVFTQSHEYDGATGEWKERILTKVGLNEDGFDLEQFPQETTETEDKPLDLSNSAIEDLSLKLSDILTNPLLPQKIHDCISEQIYYDSQVDTTSIETIKSALENALKTEDKTND